MADRVQSIVSIRSIPCSRARLIVELSESTNPVMLKLGTPVPSPCPGNKLGVYGILILPSLAQEA
jgi:hypothetical protein